MGSFTPPGWVITRRPDFVDLPGRSLGPGATAGLLCFAIDFFWDTPDTVGLRYARDNDPTGSIRVRPIPGNWPTFVDEPGASYCDLRFEIERHPGYALIGTPRKFRGAKGVPAGWAKPDARRALVYPAASPAPLPTGGGRVFFQVSGAGTGTLTVELGGGRDALPAPDDGQTLFALSDPSFGFEFGQDENRLAITYRVFRAQYPTPSITLVNPGA
jgi:hypothetical protein